MPKSVLHYELDKVRYLDQESFLCPVLFSQIKKLMVQRELNIHLDHRFKMNLMFSISFYILDVPTLSAFLRPINTLLLQYEILEELVTCMP